MAHPFRVSTGLKDLIGRGLITSEYVAVFELVKNSFDAHASKVIIQFEENKITIADNGKGMSRDDILNKWLFVAFSAKREDIEDQNYKGGEPKRSNEFAGSKGVGRFSCDRLGENLVLVSKAKGAKTQKLKMDWTLYEKDANEEFGEIEFELEEVRDNLIQEFDIHANTWTILEISELRATWDRQKLLKLKRELAKLINPFSGNVSEFEIELVVPNETLEDQKSGNEQDCVNGSVENNILEVIGSKSTSIKVYMTKGGEYVETKMEDRGEEIYHIRELNPYATLKTTELNAEIYFLNRSAKATFTRRMGLESVKFGSIFLFRNGFRVFPIGEENDDFFGLTRRKQQGQRRFLGSRDVIGRVEIQGVEGFDEATSRDQGLIHTPGVDELITCIVDKCVRRLERYVVNITWKDKFDKDYEDTSRMKLDKSSALITKLVSRLAGTEGISLVSYSKDLVRLVDEKSEAFEESLKALEVLAEKTGDDNLLKRVIDAKNRIRALEEAEEELRSAQERAEKREKEARKETKETKEELSRERERNRFLVAATSLDEDTTLNLHHQILMYASDVHAGIRRMMRRVRKGARVAQDDLIGFLERTGYRNSQIITASRFATKGGYRQQSSAITADLSGYIKDYIETISTIWVSGGINIFVKSDLKEFEREFRPIEIGIVIDNLVSNASKASASSIGFFIRVEKGANPVLKVCVADDGWGWEKSINPLESIFEIGTTTTNGSGLGLNHVKQVVQDLGGEVEAKSEAYNDTLLGAHLELRFQ